MAIFNFKNLDFPHLKSFRTKFLGEEDEVIIDVDFGLHCFTKDLYQNSYDEDKILRTNIIPENIITYSGETREFTQQRYEHSKFLKEIFSDLVNEPNNSCFFNGRKTKGKQTYFAHDQLNTNGKIDDYYIFFTIYIKKNKLKIFVQSAYTRNDSYHEKHSEIKFSTIVKKARK